MNDINRSRVGPPWAFLSPLDAREVLARVVAAREELPLDPCQAAAILLDLEDDVAALISDEGAATR